jgi:hypothetical protein
VGRVAVGGEAAAVAQRWPGEVLCTGGRGGTGAEGCQRKKKEGGPKDSFGKTKRSRDLSIK